MWHIVQGQHIYLIGGGTENRQSMWLNTVDIFNPSTHTCLPSTPLPKESAYGSVATIGQRLFYVGGGNGIDWFSSMLRLALDDDEAQWEQVGPRQSVWLGAVVLHDCTGLVIAVWCCLCNM